MAGSIRFGGTTTFKSGGLSRVVAGNAINVGPTATGIVGLIGEADGGTPGELIIIDDPALAKETFRSGPLADAIRVAFIPSNDPRIPAGAARVVCYKTNTEDAAQGTTQLPGDDALIADTVAALSTTTVINLTGGGLTVDAHIGRWFQAIIGSGTERRRIVDNTATSVTVSPAFTTIPGTGSAVQILQTQAVLTAKDYGLHTNSVGFELEAGATSGTFVTTLFFEDTTEQFEEFGGDAFLRLKYVGGPIPSNGTGLITAVTASVVTVNVAAPPLLNAFAGMVLEHPTTGIRRLILSNTAADPTAITLDTGHELSTAEQALLTIGSVANVRDVTSADASITGSNGVATGLTSAVLPTADNLSMTFNDGETLRAFVDRVNSTTNYEAVIPDGVNPDTTLMETFDFGTRATGVDVRFDDAIDPDTNGSFLRDLQLFLDQINEQSSLVTAERATAGASEGSELPRETGGTAATVGDLPIFLTGGARGTSTNSTWQDGFDTMMEERMNHVVPLISYDLVDDGFGSTATFTSVAAQLEAHLAIGATSGKNEQGGYMGMDATRDELRAQSKIFNNTDVQFVGQKFTMLDVDGNLKQFPEWGAAVVAAGMRSGAPEVGEPLTFKSINCTAIMQDSSWSPRSITDFNLLTKDGVMVAEQTPEGNFRWVRDITTYVQDTNILFVDGNMREEARFIAYDLRKGVEDAFTGIKAIPATVTNVRNHVGAKMAIYRNDLKIITPSLGEDGVTFYPEGFRKLRVSINGNVLTIRIEVFITAGIVFELSEISLIVPRLTA